MPEEHQGSVERASETVIFLRQQQWKMAASNTAEWLKVICWGCSTEPIELLSALILIGWGYCLLIPGSDVFATNPGMKAMADTAPQWAWGFVIVFIGISQMVSLLSGRIKARTLVAVCSAGIYWILAAEIWLVDVHLPGVTTYALLGITSIWLSARLGARSG